MSIMYLFCLDDLYVAVNGVCRSPYYDCVLFCFQFLPFVLLYLLYIFQYSLTGCIYIEKCCIFLMYCLPYHFKTSILISLPFLSRNLFCQKDGYTCFSVDAICLENHFTPFHFESNFVFAAQMCLLKTACGRLLSSDSICHSAFLLVNSVH